VLARAGHGQNRYFKQSDFVREHLDLLYLKVHRDFCAGLAKTQVPSEWTNDITLVQGGFFKEYSLK
jgi:hypothetical protein